MTLARSKKALKLTKGQDCTLRLVGVCNFDSTTTVAAHVGKSRGIACKCGDNMIVFACSSCHDEIDGRTMYFQRNELAADVLRALEETQQILIDNEVMVLA